MWQVTTWFVTNVVERLADATGCLKELSLVMFCWCFAFTSSYAETPAGETTSHSGSRALDGPPWREPVGRVWGYAAPHCLPWPHLIRLHVFWRGDSPLLGVCAVPLLRLSLWLTMLQQSYWELQPPNRRVCITVLLSSLGNLPSAIVDNWGGDMAACHPFLGDRTVCSCTGVCRSAIK